MNYPKVCCFTGHRHISRENTVMLTQKLRRLIPALAEDGVTTFRAGGAMGFDTLAALCVIEQREQLGLRLELILPCHNQTRGWSERDKNYYNHILKSCDSYRYISDIYTDGCMLERNRHLVNGSDFCVAYLTSNRGGTLFTVNYAQKNGVKVINLAENI